MVIIFIVIIKSLYGYGMIRKLLPFYLVLPSFPISYCYFVNRYFSTISLTIVVISLLVVPIYLIPPLLVPCNLSLLAILFILIIINITFTIHKLHIVSPFCFVLFSVILTIEEMEMECALCHAIVVCLNY